MDAVIGTEGEGPGPSGKARKSRNPQTGAVLKIAAKKVPVFKAGQCLKDAVK
jgi:nucleoid DNA-binding protein